ncbi:hypothetical protein Taro_002656, partial [Colocasia esculenta]|nr:hypothetical protein [Colocasia esculenta]
MTVALGTPDVTLTHLSAWTHFAEMDQLPGSIDHSVLYAQKGHRSLLVYIGQETLVLKCWEHHRSLGGRPVDPRIMHVPDRVLRQFGRVQPIPGPVDALDRVTQKGRGHIDWAKYFAHFVQMWHRQKDYIIPLDEDTVGIGKVEYISWYWSITRRYIGRPGFTYDMHYEPCDHIERSPVEDSSTSDAGPLEPCAGTPQQPDDAGPPQFSPDLMTLSQHSLYDVGASQILTDEGMPDTQPPQSIVGTYHRQRRHRGSTSTLPQQSQSDLLWETFDNISKDMDSETTQSESCDAILVHETQSQSEIEVDAQDEIQEQCHNRGRGRGRGRASRKGKKT